MLACRKYYSTVQQYSRAALCNRLFFVVVLFVCFFFNHALFSLFLPPLPPTVLVPPPFSLFDGAFIAGCARSRGAPSTVAQDDSGQGRGRAVRSRGESERGGVLPFKIREKRRFVFRRCEACFFFLWQDCGDLLVPRREAIETKVAFGLNWMREEREGGDLLWWNCGDAFFLCRCMKPEKRASVSNLAKGRGEGVLREYCLCCVTRQLVPVVHPVCFDMGNGMASGVKTPEGWRAFSLACYVAFDISPSSPHPFCLFRVPACSRKKKASSHPHRVNCTLWHTIDRNNRKKTRRWFSRSVFVLSSLWALGRRGLLR